MYNSLMVVKVKLSDRGQINCKYYMHFQVLCADSNTYQLWNGYSLFFYRFPLID